MNNFLKILFVFFIFVGLFYAPASFARTVTWNDPQTQNSSIPLYWKFFDGYISYINLRYEPPENIHIPDDADLILSYTNKDDPLVLKINTKNKPIVYMGEHYWFVPTFRQAYQWVRFFTWKTNLNKKIHVADKYESLKNLGINDVPRKIIILHKTHACYSLNWFWKWWNPCAPDKPHTFYFSTFNLPRENSGIAQKIKVSYNARIINSDTGEEIKNGETIPIGTNIILKFSPHDNTDIQWIGAKQWRHLLSFLRWREGWTKWGFRIWDENEFWRLYPKYNIGLWTDLNELPNAACRNEDLIFTNRIWRFNKYFFGNILHYATMAVTKPKKHLEITGLNCSELDNNNESRCVVTTPGVKTIKFVFEPTKLKSYHSYKKLKWDLSGWKGFDKCLGINDILYKSDRSYEMPKNPDGHYYWHSNNRYYYKYKFYYTDNDTAENLHDFSPFEEDVPEQSITYKIIASDIGGAPEKPQVSVESPILANSSTTISISSTDPDNDTLRYGIDWDNNDSVDEWLPASGYTQSGDTLQTSHSWTEEGNKTFTVIAEDSNRARSEKTEKSVSVLKVPLLIFKAKKYLIKKGQSSTLNWYSKYASSCVASQKWRGNKILSGSEDTGPLEDFQNEYVLSCSNALSSTTKSIRIFTYACGDNVCTDSVESCATCPADCGECDASNTANPDLFINLTQEPPEVHYGGENE